jgi:hypothetical protein
MIQAKKQKAINASYFITGVSVLEFIFLTTIAVSWIYAYNEDSKILFLLTLLHMTLIITMPLGFITSRNVRVWRTGDGGTSFLYALGEFANLVLALIALTFHIINYLTCDTNVFCSEPSGLGLFVTTLLLAVTCLIIITSLIGMISGSYIHRTLEGERIPDQFIQTRSNQQTSSAAARYWNPYTRRPMF